MNNCFKKLFHLQGLKVLDSHLEGKKMIISCQSKKKETRCHSCGKIIKTIHQNLKSRRIKHMFWQSNLIELDLKRRTYFCWKCKKKGLPWITIENIPIIPKGKRYSLVYADQVMKGLGQTTFKTQQELAETSFSTLQKLLSLRIDPFIGVWPKDMAVRSIGIDLHSFSGTTMLPTVCNLTDHRLITILPDNKQPTMRNFLRYIPQELKEKIEEVCIDMDCHYLKLIHEELPSARIVIDFFHVVQDANFRITQTRTLIQKTGKIQLPKRLFEKNREHLNPNERVELNSIFKAYPELGELWKVKEQIRSIHKNPSTQLAAILYGKLLKEMRLSQYPSIKQWAKTLNRWQDGILAYFTNHTTNGYTEGVNTKLKTIKRLSYGFRNIDNYIRKALLAFIPISLLLYHYI
jgi:transposase